MSNKKCTLKFKVDFCLRKCGHIENRQMRMLKHHIKNNTFYGVGRAIGRTKYMPLVSMNGKAFNVIDGAGYYQIASIENRLGFTAFERT